MMKFGINGGGSMEIHDDNTTFASANIIRDINDAYIPPNGKPGKKPEISDINKAE